MLPHISAEENLPPVVRKVYINPNFNVQGRSIPNSISSNNNMLQPWERPAIHINPQFLQRQREFQMQQQLLQQRQQQLQHVAYYQGTVTAALTPPPAKIISKASTCLVRKPPVKTVTMLSPRGQPSVKTVHPPRVQPPLVSLSKRKLVRQGASAADAVAVAPSTAKRTRYKLVRAISLTSSSSTPLVKKRRSKDFVAHYALQRTNETVALKKLGSKSHVLKPSVNKCLRMVSIHGVMYKKMAKNKLTKLDSTKTGVLEKQQPKDTVSPIGRTLLVRGTKFVLDPSGCRLTRVPVNNINKSLRLRIDIGGLTYVSSPKAQNVFIRTTNHVSRAHLITAKQRSMQLLNRSLVKTNVPCAIFQRLGKCAAHGRGKCRRLHDKRQVAICPSFLRGECTKSPCLLSHNVTLEKMPVCRYYLLGVCVREDCPYLHKKLSRKAEICIDFLRGYCSRAADCNMRHEYVCPELERKGKCELTNCAYCKQMKQNSLPAKSKIKANELLPNLPTVPGEEISSSSRYFKRESDKDKALNAEQPENKEEEEQGGELELEDASTGNLSQRPKLGALPAFIPIGKGSDGISSNEIM